MSNMNKFFTVLAMLTVLALPACKELEGLSVATSDCLKDQAKLESGEVLVIPNDQLPKEIVESEKLQGKKVIIAPTELLKPECTTMVPVPPSDGDWMGWALSALGAAAGVASIFLPKLALLEGFLLLLSRRKREHYTAAAKAVLPYDGSVDMKGAVMSLGKALGILHTNAGTTTTQTPPPTA
jgi:hypothetical protein